ncbi:MAG: Gfo/Idh/MocA family oxidoreductase [Armatimonadota bacterium]|nr:Gfo/Idh/MocA family oxidoreductase [Armatimonadota bacterium]
MDRLRVGVIGVGRMAEICHLPILAELPQVELVAFCDTDAEALSARGAEYDVAARYADHHEMFDAEVFDAVCIFIPPYAHTDAEIMAAGRGIHVFVEKPPTLSMDQAREIDEAITRSGVISQVGFNSRHRRSCEAARERLEGRDVVQAVVHRLHGSGALAWWWKLAQYSGGPFVENTIHQVDLLRWIAGDLTAVSARMVERPEPTDQLDIPLSVCATYTLASGGLASVTTCAALEGRGHSAFLIVADGSLYDLSGGCLAVDGERVAEDEPGRVSYRRQFASFFDAIIKDDPSLTRSPYGDGIGSLAAVLAAVHSARNGGAWVDLLADPAWAVH